MLAKKPQKNVCWNFQEVQDHLFVKWLKKKEKEVHAIVACAPKTAKIMSAACDTYLVKMEKH